MTKLTTEQVRAELERIVQEKGADYVYEHVSTPLDNPIEGSCECFYADPNTGEPSCLVGRVFASLIPDLFEELSRHEGVWGYSRAVEELYETSVGPLIREYLPPEAAEGLNSAQSAQDAGRTWGTALERFDEAVRSYHWACESPCDW